MDILSGFRNGVNLGGWISQYSNKGKAHFDSFITEKDIERIASWGMDHVRLPFDYNVIEKDSSPFVYSEEGFSYIDSCIEWCGKRSLNIILDLHLAPGQSYDTADPVNPLLTNAENRKRALELWKAVARRYKGSGGRMIFEILNEIVDMTHYMWNPFVREAIGAIRSMDAGRIIMVGGNEYNSVFTLKELERQNDELIAYTFHFYEPQVFTHQKAHWVKETHRFDSVLEYPGDFSNLSAFLDENPKYANYYGKYAWLTNNRDLLYSYLKDARLFMKHVSKNLYCGEFGVIDSAPPESRRNWLADFTGLLDEHGIARAYWSYKEMDFGLVDINGNIKDIELVNILRRRK